MNRVTGLLVVSVMMGAVAAVAALAIARLTSASLSPAGGAMLGIAFGLTGSSSAGRKAPVGPWIRVALLRAAVAGCTALAVTMLLQYWRPAGN